MHNSVFAAHRLQCRMTIRKIDIRHFVSLEEIREVGSCRRRRLGRRPNRRSDRKSGINMGLTGLEPVTLRLSSACSNQLSYRPARNLASESFSDLTIPVNNHSITDSLNR
jgi:hypothetical protein